MNLVKFYHPVHSTTKNLVNEMFNSFLTNDYHENYLLNCRKPAINIFETDNEFSIELMLPGFKKEDLKINFHEELLTVKVDNVNVESRKDEVYKYARREFDLYNFEKQFKVPQSVKTDGIDAKFENGILLVTLPKKEEALEKAPVDIRVL